MNYLRQSFHAVVLVVLGMTSHIWSQADYMPPMSGWPAAIQTAWQIQGEYYGTQSNGTAVLGAWLISSGGTNYSLVILPGGLLTLPNQPFGGWNQTTRYQGATGPAAGTLNGKIFNVSTSTGGYVADSITGAGEARSMYVHNTSGAAFKLDRVKRHSPTLGLTATQAQARLGALPSPVVSIWDSVTGLADISKWTTKDNAPSVKYNYLYRGGQTIATYGTHFLHIEFLSCFNPTATGQGRANSGIYFQSHYETQVLDSYGLSGAIDEYGAIYTVRSPNVNAELPPQVTLQTYDVYFTGRSSGNFGDATGGAIMTVYANGVLVQSAVPVNNVTTAGSTTPGALLPGPLYLQNHNNEVVFNNIWAIPNATVANLPYATILGAVTPVKHSFLIKPLLHKNGLELFGFTGNHDLSGRKIRRHGAVLSIQPTVLFQPLNP